MTVTPLSSLRFGIASASLGMHANHTLKNRFDAMAKAGFKYCELGFGAYMEWVRSECPDLPPSTCPPEWSEGGEPDPKDEAIWEAMYTKADDMKAFAASYGLTILMLQPLNQFDGWPETSPRAAWVKEKALKWLPLCSKLGVEMLQVGGNDYAEANASDEKTAQDLHWLAELGATQNPPVKIAYECWSFSKRVHDWEHTWRLIQLGNHPNLGLCLDVAHFPLSPRYGWIPTTGKGWSDSEYSAMLDRLVQVPGDKIFYVELADVVKPNIPLYRGSAFDAWGEKAQSPRGDIFVWAICGRPVPLVGPNAGRAGVTPDDARVVESVKAIMETGFNGPMMYEMFEALSQEKEDEDIPYVYAQACAFSKERLIAALDSA